MFKYACCGILNRGAAIYDGKVYRTTLDAHVIALDAKTGKQLWKSKAADYQDGHAMTGAPLVVNGVRDDRHRRRRIRHARLHRRLGRRRPARSCGACYTTAAPGEKGGDTWPGDTAQKGGAPTWLTGAYDPELDLVYWGTGNGGPWNPQVRMGDNLYVCSVLAFRPKTGELVWHYQFSPNDPYDYDTHRSRHAGRHEDRRRDRARCWRRPTATASSTCSTAPTASCWRPTRTSRSTGPTSIDMATGRPVESEVTKKMRAGERRGDLAVGARRQELDADVVEPGHRAWPTPTR